MLHLVGKSPAEFSAPIGAFTELRSNANLPCLVNLVLGNFTKIFFLNFRTWKWDSKNGRFCAISKVKLMFCCKWSNDYWNQFYKEIPFQSFYLKMSCLIQCYLPFLCNYLWHLLATSESKLFQSKSYTIFFFICLKCHFHHRILLNSIRNMCYGGHCDGIVIFHKNNWQKFSCVACIHCY